MLDKFKKFFKKEEPIKNPEPIVKKVSEKKRAPKEKVLSPKDEADKKGKPYVSITKVHVDPNDVNNGSFELDWNDKFVVNLIKAGYKMKPTDTDSEIVDRWFQTVCRNVALEVYEQMAADPEKRNDIRIIQSRDIGNGRSEVS